MLQKPSGEMDSWVRYLLGQLFIPRLPQSISLEENVASKYFRDRLQISFQVLSDFKQIN